MYGPLDGLRILDLSRQLPGPFATRMLADLGADVLRIEDPDVQDVLRSFPPLDDQGRSVTYLSMHRKKRSIGLRLRSPAAAVVVQRLIQHWDILVENFRPGVLLGSGMEPAVLLERNPRLIYCSITGYGQEGARSRRAGHDINYLSLSGLASTTGVADGDLAVPGFQVTDLAAGSMTAVIAILAAARQRDGTGRGQHLDVAMTEAALTLMPVQTPSAVLQSRSPSPGADVLSGGLPSYRYYRCADGRYLSVGALEPKFWQRLCLALGISLPYPLPYGHGSGDTGAQLEKLFLERPRDEWVQRLEAADCCVEPVLDLYEALSSDYARERDILQGTETRFPVRFDTGAPAGPRPGSPLHEAGFTDAEVDALVAAGSLEL